MLQTSQKIKTIQEAQPIIGKWQQKKKKIVFTNGCFDIVHLGHIDYLEKARNFGDKLVLGLNTDASVSRLKGSSRPVVDEYARARMMAAFEFINMVVLFDESTPLELIKVICPDILVKGNDYDIKDIIGADFVLSRGGEVKTIELVEGYSTSAIIEKIKRY